MPRNPYNWGYSSARKTAKEMAAGGAVKTPPKATSKATKKGKC